MDKFTAAWAGTGKRQPQLSLEVTHALMPAAPARSTCLMMMFRSSLAMRPLIFRSDLASPLRMI